MGLSRSAYVLLTSRGYGPEVLLASCGLRGSPSRGTQDLSHTPTLCVCLRVPLFSRDAPPAATPAAVLLWPAHLPVRCLQTLPLEQHPHRPWSISIQLIPLHVSRLCIRKLRCVQDPWLGRVCLVSISVMKTLIQWLQRQAVRPFQVKVISSIRTEMSTETQTWEFKPLYESSFKFLEKSQNHLKDYL